MLRTLRTVHESEEGHGLPLLGALISGAGIVVLALGVTNTEDWLVLTGASVAAFGLIAYNALRHIGMDYEFYKRIKALEDK
jgi:hypothetical protein